MRDEGVAAEDRVHFFGPKGDKAAGGNFPKLRMSWNSRLKEATRARQDESTTGQGLMFY